MMRGTGICADVPIKKWSQDKFNNNVQLGAGGIFPSSYDASDV
jgi:hypothetical protein